jgi:DNA-binding response OmpR family regulator
MIVDDDAVWLQTLKTWLDREGFRTVVLARAEWIVPAIELYHPDVVVLDVQLPGRKTGLDLVGTLRRRFPALFIVVSTAFGGTATADTARRLGASSYLDKPFRISALVALMRQVRPSAQHDDARVGPAAPPLRSRTNDRNEPVCPICGRVFKPGDPVMRAGVDNDCMVHMLCVGEADRRGDPWDVPTDASPD